MKNHRGLTRSLLAAAVLLAAASFFAAPDLAAPKGSKGPHNLQTWLGSTGETPGAWGKAKFKFVRKFNRLTVEVHGLGAGVYDVLLDGASVGSISVAGSAAAQSGVNKLVVDSRSAGALIFDPRGKPVAVVNTGSLATELAAARFPANKSEEKAKTLIAADFTNTGVQPDASGEAEFRSFKGRSKFEVRVQGLAPGTYDLLVGGESRGQVTVTTEAEVELAFDSLAGRADDQGDDDAQGDDDPDDDGGQGLLLTFDPRGLPVAISVGGVVVLSIDPFPTL